MYKIRAIAGAISVAAASLAACDEDVEGGCGFSRMDSNDHSVMSGTYKAETPDGGSVMTVDRTAGTVAIAMSDGTTTKYRIASARFTQR